MDGVSNGLCMASTIRSKTVFTKYFVYPFCVALEGNEVEGSTERRMEMLLKYRAPDELLKPGKNGACRGGHSSVHNCGVKLPFETNL